MARFVPLEEAVHMSGVRVTFLEGMPALWAECLKNFLDARKVPYTRALHPRFDDANPASQDFLYQLTAQRSLPTMLYNDERPRNSWIEQVVLADQLGSGPSLIPTDPEQRVLMFGLMNELLGEDGLMWNKRLCWGQNSFTRKYGYTEEKGASAPTRIIQQLQMFLRRLEQQKAAGTSYLMGDSVTALDIYLATGTYMFAPPGPNIIPRTKENSRLLEMFATNPPEVQEVLDNAAILMEHRDHVLTTYCVVPAVQGGTPVDTEA